MRLGSDLDDNAVDDPRESGRSRSRRKIEYGIYRGNFSAR